MNIADHHKLDAAVAGELHSTGGGCNLLGAEQVEVASGAVSRLCRLPQGISASFVCTACSTLLCPQPILFSLCQHWFSETRGDAVSDNV
jgi:hypothetical protein